MTGSELTEELIKSEDDEDTSDTTRPNPRAPRMEGESEDDDDESDRLTEMGTDDGTGWDAVKAEDMTDDGMTSGVRQSLFDSAVAYIEADALRTSPARPAARSRLSVPRSLRPAGRPPRLLRQRCSESLILVGPLVYHVPVVC